MKALIITADDFGAAVEVNEAIERAHLGGVLAAASLMVSGTAVADAIRRASTLPKLRVGLHLVLVDGKPVLPPELVPDLVDSAGRFRSNMALAGASMFFLPHVRRQLASEIEAQFKAFAATGLPLDHVNAHKHFHLHPTIAALTIEIGQRYGVAAARVPLEPKAVVAAVDGKRGISSVDPIAPFCLMLARRFRAAGIATTERVFGLAWSGAVTSDRLRALIGVLPDGSSEIYLHPATEDVFPGSAPGYRYRDELAALLDPLAKRALQQNDVRLGGFADFNLGR